MMLLCAYGKHVIDAKDWYYVVNPEGGYGRREVLCCETCIHKVENSYVRQRMIDAGAKELA